MKTNHPAHGSVSLERLHQIREILSKAAAQSDGGNLGYAMADAVKVINGAIAAFDAAPVAYMYKDKLHTDARFSLDTRFGNWSQEDINEYEITETPLYAAPPAPVSVPAAMEIDDDFDSAFEHGKAVGWNAYRAAMLQGAEPVSQPYMLPPLDYLDTVKFNADCAIQDPDSIYTNEFFLSLDEVFGERGNYSEPVQAKAVSMLIAEVFRLRGYSRAAPQQEDL